MYENDNLLPIVDEQGNDLWEITLPCDVVSKRGDLRNQVIITYYAYAATKQQSIDHVKAWLPLWDTGTPKYIISGEIFSKRYVPNAQQIRREHRNKQRPQDTDLQDEEILERDTKDIAYASLHWLSHGYVYNEE